MQSSQSHAIRTSSRPPPPIGVVVPTREPLARVLDLGGRATTSTFVGALVALVLHGTAAARAALIPLDLIHWTQGVRALVHDKLWSTYDVDMVREPDEKPAPPPEPEPVPEPAPQAREARAPAPKAEPNEPPPPPAAPAAAQAGQVLASDEVDFTGDGFAQGNAANYAGGVTHAQGTSTSAVRNMAARPDGVPGGTGSAPAPPPPAVDRSRSAGLRGSSDWKCPWPAEADAEQIDEAYVTVRVTVGPDGRAKTVAVVSDPGHGFGREARICALRETYKTALDREGNPIEGQTNGFRIHFER